jgi:NADPH-dependent 7-cyano-7-deazaguanine reductase QueF
MPDVRRDGVLVMLFTQPNTRPGVAIWQSHTLALPSCCPVSGNPQPGSTITLSYSACDTFLEVYSLRKYIESYIGGREAIRDMEGMVQAIATDCAAMLGVTVLAYADIVLQRGDRMVIICRV